MLYKILHFFQENEDKDLKLPSRVSVVSSMFICNLKCDTLSYWVKPNKSACVQVVSLLFGGDISTSAQTFEKWLSLVRKRSGAFRPSGFPHRGSRIEVMPSGSFSLFGSGDLRFALQVHRYPIILQRSLHTTQLIICNCKIKLLCLPNLMVKMLNYIPSSNEQ